VLLLPFAIRKFKLRSIQPVQGAESAMSNLIKFYILVLLIASGHCGESNSIFSSHAPFQIQILAGKIT
jgi:hypothetical protein